MNVQSKLDLLEKIESTLYCIKSACRRKEIWREHIHNIFLTRGEWEHRIEILEMAEKRLIQRYHKLVSQL